MSISSLQNQPIPSPLGLENQAQNNVPISNDEAISTKPGSTKTQEKIGFFENFLNRSDKSTRPSNEILNQKLADIRHKAKLVQGHPLPNIIGDYVKEVKSFLTDVKDHAYKHQMSDDGLFEKMELIDKKLADIGDKILEDNKNELELVANLGELQGLLIDFYI